jgi:hypothetical protein
MPAMCKNKGLTGRNCGDVHNYKQKPGDVILRNNPVSLPRNETRTDRLDMEDLLQSPSLDIT